MCRSHYAGHFCLCKLSTNGLITIICKIVFLNRKTFNITGETVHAQVYGIATCV